MTHDQNVDAGHQRLLAAKAERLADLLKRKPGQKGYKRSLKAFLEADAAAQRSLLAHIEQDAAAAAIENRSVSSSDADPRPPE